MASVPKIYYRPYLVDTTEETLKLFGSLKTFPDGSRTFGNSIIVSSQKSIPQQVNIAGCMVMAIFSNELAVKHLKKNFGILSPDAMIGELIEIDKYCEKSNFCLGKDQETELLGLIGTCYDMKFTVHITHKGKKCIEYSFVIEEESLQVELYLNDRHYFNYGDVANQQETEKLLQILSDQEFASSLN